MTFSEDVRSELAGRLPDRACCRLALVSGIVRGAGTYHLQGHGRVHVEVDLAAGPAARRTVQLLRALGAAVEIRTWSERRFAGAHRIGLVLGDDPATRAVLVAAGLLSARGNPNARPPRRVTGRACCRAAYLRGAFVASGSVAGPRRPAQLEIRMHDRAAAELVAALAARDGIPLRVRERATYAAAYAKRLETIGDLLAHVGAEEAALRLAEAEVVARTRESANRRANADTANIRRQVVAARRQLEAVERLEAAGVLAQLDAELLEAAVLRRAHPELSLAELAACGEPPLAKPTLAARLRRLVELAEPVAPGWGEIGDGEAGQRRRR